jgi:hypothetical protein
MKDYSVDEAAHSEWRRYNHNKENNELGIEHQKPSHAGAH